MLKISVRFYILLTLILLAPLSCKNLQSIYNEQAYRQAVSLKIESLDLMGQAVESFNTHREKVRSLTLELRKAHEYARGRPRNEESTRQWKLMVNRDRHLVGGFLRRWKEDTTLTRPFINETKRIVSQAFDAIIALESGKQIH